VTNKNMFSIDEARKAQQDYLPSDTTAAKLRAVEALLFVGPAGVGKSTTLSMVADLDDRFSRTGSIGTRPVAPRDDPKMFRHYPKDELLAKIADRSVVQYAVHPTTESIYATTADMYASPYNMLEMLPAGVEQFRHIGFGDLQIFYMVTQPDAWRQWFETRYPDHSEERQKRLDEAMISLQWSLDQPADSFVWLQNTSGQQEATARHIIHTTTTGEMTGDHRELAEAMLEIAKKL
jgi:guanylate kinase